MQSNLHEAGDGNVVKSSAGFEFSECVFRGENNTNIYIRELVGDDELHEVQFHSRGIAISGLLQSERERQGNIQLFVFVPFWSTKLSFFDNAKI